MSKLKIKLVRLDNVVLMKVLEQEGGRPNNSLVEHLCDHDNGLSIRSAERPEMDRTGIYIRGNDEEEDNRVAFYRLNTIEEAKEYVRKVVELVEYYNKSSYLENKEDSEIIIVG